MEYFALNSTQKKVRDPVQTSKSLRIFENWEIISKENIHWLILNIIWVLKQQMQQIASSLSTHLKSHILLIYHTFPSMRCTCGALVGLLRSLLPSPSCTMAVLTTPRPYADTSPGPGESFIRLWSTTPTRANKEWSFGLH